MSGGKPPFQTCIHFSLIRFTELLVYANFMPGEWLPKEDKGYLQSVYDAAKKLGVGVGGPDLLPEQLVPFMKREQKG